MRDIRNTEVGKWALRSFRPASVASAKVNLAKTIAQSVAFWIVFLGLVPVGLARVDRDLLFGLFEFSAQAWLPWVGFGLAGGFGLATGATMAVVGRGTPVPVAAPRYLVVKGPYRFIRNPMAVAGLAQGAFVGAALGSGLTLIYVVAGGFLWDIFVRPLEEIDLETRFGQDFVHYRSRVRCWIPRLRPYRASREITAVVNRGL